MKWIKFGTRHYLMSHLISLPNMVHHALYSSFAKSPMLMNKNETWSPERTDSSLKIKIAPHLVLRPVEQLHILKEDLQIHSADVG